MYMPQIDIFKKIQIFIRKLHKSQTYTWFSYILGKSPFHFQFLSMLFQYFSGRKCQNRHQKFKKSVVHIGESKKDKLILNRSYKMQVKDSVKKNQSTIQNSSKLVITGFYVNHLNLYIQKHQTKMNQLQNLSSICKMNQGCSPNFIQQNLNRNLSSLFNFMQTMKDLSAEQIKTKSTTDGKDLVVITKSLAKILNKEQLCYQKHYVGSICVFMSIINIPFFSKHLRLLDATFYNNLAPIFFDIIKCWERSQNTDEFAIARARLAAFSRILTQIHKNKTTYLSKVFNQSLVKVITQFQLPNDAGILRIIIKLFYQAQKFANQDQIKKIASQLYISLKHDRFPVRYIDHSIDFINSHLRLEELSTFDEHGQILKTLKNTGKENLENNTPIINLNRVIYFVSRICYYRNESAFTLLELFQFCALVKKQKTNMKTNCLQKIAKYMNVNKGKDNVELLLNFLPEITGISITQLQILQKIISNLSSASLIQLSSCDFSQRLIKIVINKSENNLNRILALRIFYALCCKMRDINYMYYQQMIYSTKYMEQCIQPEENQTLAKALKLINQFTNKTVFQFHLI